MTAHDPLAVSIDEDSRRRFEAAWAEGRPEPIEQFLPDSDDPRYLPTLEELVCVELELAWKSWTHPGPQTAAGPLAATVVRPPSVEGYLARFPPLGERSVRLRLVQYEWLVRQQHSGCPPLADYQQRFPDLAFEISLFASLAARSGLRDTDWPAQTGIPAGRLSIASAEAKLPRPFGHYESLEILAALAAQYPDVTRYQRDLAVTHLALAGLELATGQTESAVEHLRQTRKHLRQLQAKDPDNMELDRPWRV